MMLTDQEIDGLEGPCLDAAVAEQVLGWRKGYCENQHSPDVWQDAEYCHKAVIRAWSPSTSLDACRLVLEEIARRGIMHRLCHFVLNDSGYDGRGTLNFVEVGLNATPTQICRAALKAVRGGGE